MEAALQTVDRVNLGLLTQDLIIYCVCVHVFAFRHKVIPVGTESISVACYDVIKSHYASLKDSD